MIAGYSFQLTMLTIITGYRLCFSVVFFYPLHYHIFGVVAAALLGSAISVRRIIRIDPAAAIGGGA